MVFLRGEIGTDSAVFPARSTLRLERPNYVGFPRSPRLLAEPLRVAFALEEAYLCGPLMGTSPSPERESGFYVAEGLLQCPAVDACEVLQGLIVVAVHAGEAEVLHAVAVRAEGDEPLQALHVVLVIVGPHLVAFDGVSLPSPTTDFAAVPSPAVDCPPHEVPLLLREVATEVRVPTRRRDQLYGEARWQGRLMLLLHIHLSQSKTALPPPPHHPNSKYRDLYCLLLGNATMQ